MISPTVGRVVWVWPTKTSRAIAPKEGSAAQPFVGFVTYVHGDREINVAGFDHSGLHFSATRVPLMQDDDKAPEGCIYAMWMPYQKAQAAKTEALEKQLSGEK